MINNKKPQPLTFKEKKEYIKWQIELIEESETYMSHYICIEFWRWLNLKGIVTYVNVEYSLTLFPELLNAVRLAVKKNGGKYIINHTTNRLNADPIHYGSVKECNLFRLKLLKKLRFK